MPRWQARGAALAGIAALTLWWVRVPLHDPVEVFDPPIRHLDAAPLCPWREPEADRLRFFPGSTGHAAETSILSGQRVEIEKQLGRRPAPDENALLRHRVLAGTQVVGFVLTRRVKGEHGAIELVVALDPGGRIEGVTIQRWREPPAVTTELAQPTWLGRFRGRTADRGWDAEDLDLQALPSEARASAAAIREGIRSLLVLQAAAGNGLH